MKCLLVPLALSALILTGCSTAPTVASNPDPQVRFQNYHSFTVMHDPRAPSNPEVTPEIIRGARDTAAQAFGRKGLTESQNGQADLVVLVHGAIQERIDVRDWGFNYGRFSR